jgi:molecular chaperone GrpE
MTPEHETQQAEAGEVVAEEAAAAPAPEAGPDADGEAPAAETTFADAEAPPEGPAETPPAPEADAEAPADDEGRKYLALAQRTQADFDNFRKRAARDAAAAADRGTARLAKELLPALDHLELALQAAEQDAAAQEFAKGFRLVQGELAKALGRVGIESYSPRGERFDPAEHEAMAQHPVEGAESGSVVEVYQPGYRLNGMVLRPARVVVAA